MFFFSGRRSLRVSTAMTFGLLAASFSGCAGGTLGRVTSSDELPKEMPKEMKDKFEVQDEIHAAPEPVIAPVAVLPPAPKTTRKHREKKAKLPKPGAAPSAGWVKGDPKPLSPEAAASPSPLVSPSASPSQVIYPMRRPAKEPIWVGEKLVFDITYFGMSAGDFTLNALPLKAIDNRKVYHIKGTALSSSVFNLFYRLNDTVETFIDYEGIFSHRFHIILDETKQSRDSLELYDQEKKQTFYWNRWNHKDRGYSETKEYDPITPFAQDSLSAMYYLRTVPLPDGAVVEVPVVSEGHEWTAVVTVLRREEMKTPLGKVRTIVLKPETKYQGILKKQGDSFLWLTDDDRRVPVRLEAKVRIGTVVANLKGFEPGTAPVVAPPAAVPTPTPTQKPAIYQ
jgi:hypothetical protein